MFSILFRGNRQPRSRGSKPARPRRRPTFRPEIEPLETRLAPATLTTLATFDSSQGYPIGSIEDSHGDLFGTTTVFDGGSTIYEMVNNKGSYTTKTLCSFAQDTVPSLAFVDGNGNVFGTTLGDSSATVFELVNNSGNYTLQTLYVSPGSSISGNSIANLMKDADGNLFGINYGTSSGVSQATVFELANNNGSYTYQTLYTFTGGYNGAGTVGDLIMDAQGNLFGVTQSASNASIFELANSNGSYTFQTLQTLAGNTEPGNLVIDARGDLFGTTGYGGTDNDGTVFELANDNGNYTFQTLYSFTKGVFGAGPGNLVVDAHGNVYGTTVYDGANETGSVFELVNSNGTYTFKTLYSFSATGREDGSNPNDLFVDANGDLFGTTFRTIPGSIYSDDIVFELANDGSAYAFQTLYAFPFGGTPSISFMDANGNLFGTTMGNPMGIPGTTGDNTVFELTTGGGTNGNPFTNGANVNYVGYLYNNLLNRTPDASGLAYWVGQLDSGVPRSTVAYDIEHSAEYDGDQVKALYLEYLHRPADPAGLAAWTGMLLGGGTIEQVTSGILASPEYAALQGGSDSDFVASLYQGVLGRTGSANEVQGWVNALNSGESRSQVAMGFLKSTERLINQVDSYYANILDRSADPGGQTDWVDALASGQMSDQSVQASFWGSSEAQPLWS